MPLFSTDTDIESALYNYESATQIFDGTDLGRDVDDGSRRRSGEVSVAGVAQQIGAPSGSIYHRFSSKDALVGALRLRSVEKFQDGFKTAIAAGEPLEAAIAAATHVVRWSRNEFDHARLLLVHRSRDFFTAGWPEELRDRYDRQRLKA